MREGKKGEIAVIVEQAADLDSDQLSGGVDTTTKARPATT
jgi:hypothetical protein